ncbi:hypothetical protein ACFLX2_01460 [Candidatus Dependentiae bacterium]
MTGIMSYFIYVHILFALMYYLIGSFVTVVTIEHKLKNVDPKLTLATFGSVALSAIFSYIIPMYVFGGMGLFYMQIVGIISALAVQGLFWWLWFRDQLKKYLPVLLIAFALTALITMLGYNLFVWKFRAMIQAALSGVMKGIAKGAAALGAAKFFF